MVRTFLGGLALIVLLGCGGGSEERRPTAAPRTPAAAKSKATAPRTSTQARTSKQAPRRTTAKPDTTSGRNPLTNRD